MAVKCEPFNSSWLFGSTTAYCSGDGGAQKLHAKEKGVIKIIKYQ